MASARDLAGIEFARLLVQSDRPLLRYIMTFIPRRDDAEEVLQRTAAVLWEKFGEYDRQREFLPWALRVAYFEVLNFRKQLARDRLVFREEVIEALAETRQAQASRLEAQRQALRLCLSELQRRRPSAAQAALRRCGERRGAGRRARQDGQGSLSTTGSAARADRRLCPAADRVRKRTGLRETTMNTSHSDGAAERELFRRLVDQGLSPQEFADLEQRLLDDREFRARYVQYMDLEANLYEELIGPMMMANLVTPATSPSASTPQDVGAICLVRGGRSVGGCDLFRLAGAAIRHRLRRDSAARDRGGGRRHPR